jgi:hypothetical protein
MPNDLEQKDKGEGHPPTTEDIDEQMRQVRLVMWKAECREKDERQKTFLLLWIGPSIVLAVIQQPTPAAQWFLFFPPVWWLYHKIKKQFTP